eukprot:5443653-Prymnesium_polylepis.1
MERCCTHGLIITLQRLCQHLHVLDDRRTQRRLRLCHQQLRHTVSDVLMIRLQLLHQHVNERLCPIFYPPPPPRLAQVEQGGRYLGWGYRLPLVQDVIDRLGVLRLSQLEAVQHDRDAHGRRVRRRRARGDRTDG